MNWIDHVTGYTYNGTQRIPNSDYLDGGWNRYYDWYDKIFGRYMYENTLKDWQGNDAQKVIDGEPSEAPQYSAVYLISPNGSGNFWNSASDKTFTSFTVRLCVILDRARWATSDNAFEEDEFKAFLCNNPTNPTRLSVEFFEDGIGDDYKTKIVYKVGTFSVNEYHKYCPSWTSGDASIASDCYQALPCWFGYAPNYNNIPSAKVMLNTGVCDSRFPAYIATPRLNAYVSAPSDTVTPGKANITLRYTGDKTGKTIQLPQLNNGYLEATSSYTGSRTDSAEEYSVTFKLINSYETMMNMPTENCNLNISFGQGSINVTCPVTDGFSCGTGGQSGDTSYNGQVTRIIANYNNGTLSETSVAKSNWMPLLVKNVSNTITAVTVDTTVKPSVLTSIARKFYNHNCKNALLNNNEDYLTVDFTLKSALVGGVEPFATIRYGDQVQKTTTIGETTAKLGPYTTVPYTNGQFFQVIINARDRFGRMSADVTVPLYDKNTTTTLNGLRAYLYVKPSISLTGYRTNSSGGVDEVAGTNGKLTASYSFSMLDYQESSNKNGSTQPKLVWTGKSTTSTVNLSSSSGSNSKTYSSLSIEQGYEFTCAVTDPAGYTTTASYFIPSGSVLINFKAGGQGLGIGVRATTDKEMLVGWKGHFQKDIAVDGLITGPTITDIYDKIAALQNSFVDGNNQRY